MFDADLDELLSIAIFRANSQISSVLHGVEVWKYAGVEVCGERNFRDLAIEDGQVGAWLAQEGDFAPLEPEKGNCLLQSVVRILFCDRTDYRPPGFGMSKESFLAVMEHFNLPPTTLSSIFNYQGTFSRQTSYSSANPETLERLAFVLKAPQKMPIANYCLALSHNVSTKVTTAFIHGAFLQTALPTMRLSIHSQPLAYEPARRHQDYNVFRVPDAPREITQASHFISRLQCSISHWGHPILLPIILLRNYMSRSNIFAWDLDDQVVALERQTGVVFAGRTVNAGEGKIDPEKIPRDRIKSLTKEMHTLLTEIIFFERPVTWMADCAEFLEKSIKELNDAQVGDEVRQAEWKRGNREVLEMLESIRADALSLCGLQKSQKERVQSQIGVLYSFIAQIDNSINAKIAVSSARDSSAMKTLALITTVFLPGTYVATLFSMSMFSWSGSSFSSGNTSSNSSIVSNKFWIYWTITIPLTIFVMILWRVWWIWQERSYQREVSAALGSSGDEDSVAAAEHLKVLPTDEHGNVMYVPRFASGILPGTKLGVGLAADDDDNEIFLQSRA